MFVQSYLLKFVLRLKKYQRARDGDMDNSVVVHEMTHGITNRMTGGGTAACLQGAESKGLGEGWSDAMAEYVPFYKNLN